MPASTTPPAHTRRRLYDRAALRALGALAVAAVVVWTIGCGRERPHGEVLAGSATGRGDDAVVLRTPRTGGRMTAAVYPRLDSVVWRSTDGVPALDRVLAFDPSAGQLAALDTRGLPTRVDLRLGTAHVLSRARLDAVAAAGGAFYGVTADGAVTRLTDAGGTWRVRLAEVPQVLYAQRDGSVIAAAARGGTGHVWLLRPPAQVATESAAVPGATAPIATGASEGVFFAAGDELLGVHRRGLRPGIAVSLGAPVRKAVATPSGDRLYVITERGGELQVVDRYADRVSATIPLPGAARDLRMDPLGRYVLVRPARGDSTWIVAVGTDHVLGATRTDWRDDLPLVFPDGSVASAVGRDVVIVDGETLRSRQTIAGGSADVWNVVLWNGFRPRAGALVPPPSPREPAPDTAPAPDSAAADSAAPAPDSTIPRPDTARTHPDSGARPPARAPSPSPVQTPAPARATPSITMTPAAAGVATTPVRYVRTAHGTSMTSQSAGGEVEPAATAVPASMTSASIEQHQRGYTVQFAAAPTEREAVATLRQLDLPTPGGRVVPRSVHGRAVYRVVAGPFATRAEAERVKRAAGPAGAAAWIYGGAP